MPKVSVIMPVYNSEEFLTLAIDSMLNQTMSDFELIIICEYDNSIHSVEQLQEFIKRDPRINLIYNTSQKGISASLNIGIDLACGEYVARMDADDIAMPDRLQIQVDFLSSNPTIGVCGCEVEYINENGRSMKIGDAFSTEPKQIKSDLLFTCCLKHPTVMMRKSVLDKYKIRYNEAYTAAEDYELWSRLCHVTEMANLSEILLLYRWYQNNATHNKNDVGIQNYHKVMYDSFYRLGLSFSNSELGLLCPITCRIDIKNFNHVRTQLADCEQKIITANQRLQLYEPSALADTLRKRFYWKRRPDLMYTALTLRFIGGNLFKNNRSTHWYSLASYLEQNGIKRTIKKLIYYLGF